jgi:hypothetical protein
MSFLRPKREEEQTEESSPIMLALADRSIWHERTEGFVNREAPFQFVASALAMRNGAGTDELRGSAAEDSPAVPKEKILPPLRQPQLKNGIKNLFVALGVGEGSCESMSAVASRYGREVLARRLEDESCAEWLDGAFAERLARNADIPGMFREYQGLLFDGVPPPDAVRSVTNGVLSREFYSFFDDEVQNRFQDAVPFVENERGGFAATGNDANVSRMENDMRYVGSSTVLQKIADRISDVQGRDATARNWQNEKAFEDAIKGVLNAPVMNFERVLNPSYLPVPSDLGPAAAGLFSGMMRIALSAEPGLEIPLIQESNKKVSVDYHAGKGLFAAITSRFDTSSPVLKANFFLVTEPWHISRRTRGDGAYRSLGNQLSLDNGNDIDDENEEARLRTRVQGFWLLPTPPDAMLQPLLDASGLDQFKPVVQGLSTVGNAIAGVKNFILNNPFTRALNAVASIPGLESFVAVPPNFPAVRPQAYPGTKEIVDDELMDYPEQGQGRDFDYYLQEQHDFNPDPKPTFN